MGERPHNTSESTEGERAMGNGRFSGIRIDDERISWKVPALFDNDWTALTLAHELSPALGKPLFQTAYGCPACAWAGGRLCRVSETLDEATLRRYFEAYGKVGSRCAFTFSRADAGRFVDDPYCNMLLALIDEYEGQAIVVDDVLARHIRATHPGVSIVASNNKAVLARWKGFDGVDELEFYHGLLETYDEVVVRVETMLDDTQTERLADIADRTQVIVNQLCAKECQYAPQHIANVAARIKEGSLVRFDGIKCIHFLEHGMREREDTIYVPRARRKILADRGFRLFKLSGRNASCKGLATNIISEILRADDADVQAGAGPESTKENLMERDDIRELLYPITLMQVLDADPKFLTGIPEALR